MAAKLDGLGPPTLADLLADLGDLPADRVRLVPPPGTASEDDLVFYDGKRDAHYELADGTLIIKLGGWSAASITSWLITHLFEYLNEHDVGKCVGPGCHFRLKPGLIRTPTIAYCTWETLEEVDADAPIANIIPDLVVEMFYPTTTIKELTRKRKEYFRAGVRRVWQINPDTKTVETFTPSGSVRTLRLNDTLDGRPLLPGFELPIRTLFSPPSGPSRRLKR